MHAVRETSDRSSLSLWFGLFGGHAAWTVHLLVAYFLLEIGCQRGFAEFALPMTLATLVPALVTVAAALVAYRSYRQTGEDATERESCLAERTRFMGLLGVVLNVLFIFAIVLGGVGIVILPRCG